MQSRFPAADAQRPKRALAKYSWRT